MNKIFDLKGHELKRWKFAFQIKTTIIGETG